MGFKMRSSIAKSITETVSDLNKSGIVDDITMKNINSLCIPDVHDYTPESIISIRKKNHLSQAALATVFNISLSTIQKWEQGTKKPAGASRKLLDVMERKGLEALV
jgi:putative transcriptional regulator